MCKKGKGLPYSNKCRRNDEIRKPAFAISIVITVSGKKVSEKEDMIESPITPHKERERKCRNFTEAKPVDTALLRVFKVNIIYNWIIVLTYLQIQYTEKGPNVLCGILLP